MKEDGLFILDCFNPDIKLIVEGEKGLMPISEYKTADGREILIKQTMRYERKKQINRIEWHFFIDGKFDSIQNLDMRMYFPKELDFYLEMKGFKIVEKYGDFQEGAFNDDSDKQIYVCERKDLK